MQGILSALPTAVLTKAFTTPFDNAVATARTCYSSRIIYDEDVRKNDEAKILRDKIAKSTYVAGHHTTLQHAHFQFAFTNISRHALWSFFHAHPFYNSEQVSQRYVSVKGNNFLCPDFLHKELNERYHQAMIRQEQAYQDLIKLLHNTAEVLYFEIYRGRRKNSEDKRWQGAIKKRCQEVARYVLPVATHAHLYHTISGLTLHRYNRMALSSDCPFEQRILISAMVDQVKKFDPDFFKYQEESIPLEQGLESQALFGAKLPLIDCEAAWAYSLDFDTRLNNHHAVLSSSTPNPEQVLGDAVRQMLYIDKTKLSDEDAVALLLSPTKNRYLGESLNVMTLSKLARALELVHFTFIKKLSHAADSQAQRHRMLPGARALFSRTIDLTRPDYITPELFLHKQAQDAKSLYDWSQEKTYEDALWLYERGASP
ncbi:MAG TPA: FAD-dependent thymidylate synthase, partial [Myxococcota bacterium]|nr:FAD-dependent thymidylate synthase [Myxococcota bacterium]